MKCVYCAVQTGSLTKAVGASSLKGQSGLFSVCNVPEIWFYPKQQIFYISISAGNFMPLF